MRPIAEETIPQRSHARCLLIATTLVRRLLAMEVVLPASINGCGTTWYGASDRERDGSYVVTEWIVFLFMPLIPLGSKRVWPMPKEQTAWWKASVGNQFKVTRVPMNWSQVVKGYAVTAGIVLFCRLFL